MLSFLTQHLETKTKEPEVDVSTHASSGYVYTGGRTVQMPTDTTSTCLRVDRSVKREIILLVFVFHLPALHVALIE